MVARVDIKNISNANGPGRVFRAKRDATTPSGESLRADPWFDLPTFAGVVVMLGVLAIGASAMLIAGAVAAVYTLLGPRQAMQALAAIVLMKILNGQIYAFPPYLGLLAWGALFLAAARVLPKLNAGALPVIGPLWSFVLVVAMLTAFGSANSTVSWFKVASFAVGATAIVLAALSLSEREVRLLRVQLPTVVFAVASVSLLTVPIPGISRPTPWLFQGVLINSQTLGAFLAPLATLFAGRLLFRRKEFRKVDAVALALIVALIIASGTRTAALAVFLGLLGATLLGAVRNRASRKEALRAMGLAVSIAVVVLAAALSSNAVRNVFTAFVFKQTNEESVEGAFMASRGKGIESHWQRFLEKPVIGHGFGVYPDKRLTGPPQTFMGLPISAPVEKGFLPTAVLEEVGIVGGTAFLFLVAALVRRVFRTDDRIWTGVLLTCLFLNLGEATFFSMGGDGLLYWLWMGVAMRGTAPLRGRPRRGEPEGALPPKRGSTLKADGGLQAGERALTCSRPNPRPLRR